MRCRVFLVLITATLALSPTCLAEPDSTPDSKSGSVADKEAIARNIISNHKADYIAAVVEPMGPPACQTDDSKTICRHHVKIVELLCGRQGGAPWPTDQHTIYLAAGSNRNAAIDKALVLAYPSADSREGYASMMMSPPTKESVHAVSAACHSK
jgi:hypothetical protein